jgi:hypothetical protein
MAAALQAEHEQASKLNNKADGVKEPRWLALIAMLASGLLYAALPSSLSLGPDWLLLAVMAALILSTLISHRVGHHRADKTLGYAASGILTLTLVWSLGLLVVAIPKHEIEPKVLLRSSVALWVTNILVFALWYWRLDAGGPHEREKVPGHKTGAFLFPQMNPEAGSHSRWSPNVCGLLILSLQHEHGSIAHGYAGSLPVGEGADDDTGDNFTGRACIARRQSCEHSLDV